jgi:hypothetical protein
MSRFDKPTRRRLAQRLVGWHRAGFEVAGAGNGLRRPYTGTKLETADTANGSPSAACNLEALVVEILETVSE